MIRSRWRSFDRDEGRSLRLLLFGALVAIAGTVELSRVHPAPWTILGTRSDGLRQTLAALDRGAPILTSLLPKSNTLYRAGGGDDQGLYLFVPWLAHTIGCGDPVNLLRWIALLAFGVAVAMYPWLIRELSGSTVAGLLSPFVLLIGLWLLPLADIYWVAAWVAIALLPLLLLLDRRWPRFGLSVLVGLLVLASLCSSIRSQAGLPVLVGAILILFRRSWPRLGKTGAIVLCLVAYLSVSTFGMAAARSVREAQLDGRVLAGSGTGHPFWHTAYIGLGYLPNDWDIRYYDAIAYRDVLREDPKAMFLGPAYGGILRDRYFTLVGRDPLFYVEEQGAKVLVASAAAGIALLALALAVPWLMFVDAGRPRWRRDGVFIGMAGLIALASPLLATPDSSYLLGWLGVVLFAAILAAAAIVADWSSPTGVGRVLLSPRALVRAPRGVVASTAVASVLVLVVAGAVGPSIKSTAQRWHDEIQTPHVEQPPDATH